MNSDEYERVVDEMQREVWLLRWDLPQQPQLDAIDPRDVLIRDQQVEIERLREAEVRANDYVHQINRLWEAIYEHGESPMDQRVQIDPVEFLRTRYVSVTEHNTAMDTHRAEIERLREQLQEVRYLHEIQMGNARAAADAEDKAIRERDEAREAARWLLWWLREFSWGAMIDHGQDRIMSKRWPWLEEK